MSSLTRVAVVRTVLDVSDGELNQEIARLVARIAEAMEIDQEVDSNRTNPPRLPVPGDEVASWRLRLDVLMVARELRRQSASLPSTQPHDDYDVFLSVQDLKRLAEQFSENPALASRVFNRLFGISRFGPMNFFRDSLVFDHEGRLSLTSFRRAAMGPGFEAAVLDLPKMGPLSLMFLQRMLPRLCSYYNITD